MNKFEYLPEATQNVVEYIDETIPLELQGIFRGLLKQVFEDGRQEAYASMQEQRRRDEQEELRKPHRL